MCVCVCVCVNRRRLPSSGYLSAELSELAAMQPGGPGGPGAGGASGHGGPGGPGGAGGGANPLAGAPVGRVVAERRWRLGVHARGHPSTLMAELLRVLQVCVCVCVPVSHVAQQ